MIQINHVLDITKLDFTYPDSSFVMQKDNNSWSINGEALDSSKVATYLNSLSSLYGSEFVDDAVVPGPLKFSLRIEGKNFQPVELKAYSADVANQYIITSSMNVEGKFSGLKGDLTKRIFVGKDNFKVAPKGKKK